LRKSAAHDQSELDQNTPDLALASQPETPTWQLPERGDRIIQIRVSRNTLIAFIFSILVHLVLLITLAPKLLNLGEPPSGQATSLDVQLSLPKPNIAQIPVPPEQAPTVPRKPVQKSQYRTKTQPSPKLPPAPEPSPEVMTAEKPRSPNPTPPNLKPPITRNLPQASSEPLPGEDMQTYIKRQKEQRQAAQGYTQKDSDEINTRDSSPMSEEDKRTAAIQRNLQPQGGNGIFQIREISLRTGRFTFKGWKNDYSKARQRDFDVEVPPGGDIQRAMVKKMIAIIREEYTGDFNWDSQRLGKVISLSARPADNAGLEDFLIEEFFGRGGIAPR
jgi:hypothetical protein